MTAKPKARPEAKGEDQEQRDDRESEREISEDKNTDRASQTSSPQRVGYRGGAGLGRAALNGLPSSDPEPPRKATTNHPQSGRTPKRGTMTQQEFGRLVKEWTKTNLDSILVRRILGSYAAMRGRDNQKAILLQRRRPKKDKRGIGAAPMKEVEPHPVQDAMVCASCGAKWKPQPTKWLGVHGAREDSGRSLPGTAGPTCGVQRHSVAPRTQQRRDCMGTPEQRRGDGQGGPGGRCELGLARPALPSPHWKRAAALTLARQIPQQQRVHIRQEILEQPSSGAQSAGGPRRSRTPSSRQATSRRTSRSKPPRPTGVQDHSGGTPGHRDGTGVPRELPGGGPRGRGTGHQKPSHGKAHVMQQVVRGKPAGLMDSVMKNHDKEEGSQQSASRTKASPT